MHTQVNRRAARRRIRFRIRKKVSGSTARPRLAVFRSLKHIYVQAIDDESGRTLVCASTAEKSLRGDLKHGADIEAAKRVGGEIGRKLKESGVETVVFDRGGFVYHGRIKALAEAVRESGVKF